MLPFRRNEKYIIDIKGQESLELSVKVTTFIAM